MDILFLKFRDFSPQVAAHEVEFRTLVFLCRVDCDFRGGKRKDQPAVAGVDRGESQDVAQESSIALSVPAVEDCMCAKNHKGCPFSLHDLLSPDAFPQADPRVLPIPP